jgi:hypothetical protein
MIKDELSFADKFSLQRRTARKHRTQRMARCAIKFDRQRIADKAEIARCRQRISEKQLTALIEFDDKRDP